MLLMYETSLQYVATLREQLEQLSEDKTPEGLLGLPTLSLFQHYESFTV